MASGHAIDQLRLHADGKLLEVYHLYDAQTREWVTEYGMMMQHKGYESALCGRNSCSNEKMHSTACSLLPLRSHYISTKAKARFSDISVSADTRRSALDSRISSSSPAALIEAKVQRDSET